MAELSKSPVIRSRPWSIRLEFSSRHTKGQQRRFDLGPRPDPTGTDPSERVLSSVGDELHDLLPNLLVHELRIGPADRIEGLFWRQRRQPHAVAAQRWDVLAELFEQREEILPETDDDAKIPSIVWEIDRLATLFELALDRDRDLVLDQVLQLDDQICHLRAIGRQGEQLLELIKHQHRLQEMVAGAPKHGPVKELPQGSPLPVHSRMLHISAQLLDAGPNPGLDLGHRMGRTRRKVDANRHGQEPAFTEPGKETGVDQRGLSQPRTPEEQGRHVTTHQPEQPIRLPPAAKEERGLTLAKGEESRKWILFVHRESSTIGSGPFGHRRPAFRLRRSRILRLVSSTNSSVGTPPGNRCQ